MLDIIGLIIPFFGLIALGYLTAWVRPQPLEAMGWLNTFIIYLALPALFFKLLSQTPIEQLARFDFIAVNVGVTAGIFLLTLLIGLIESGVKLAPATVQGLAGAYGNIGYMGPGIALLALGERAAVPVALIFCFENVLHFVMAPALMALAGRREGGGQREGRIGLGALILSILAKILLHPFILATIVGVAAAYIKFAPPAPVAKLIEFLAAAAAPCALFAMGVTLALRPLKRMPAALAYLTPIKLLLHPAAMFLALSLLGDFDPLWVSSAVLLASLPTATNVFVIAQQYDVWSERASATILVTTVLSILTVTLWLYAIKGGWLAALIG